MYAQVGLPAWFWQVSNDRFPQLSQPGWDHDDPPLEEFGWGSAVNTETVFTGTELSTPTCRWCDAMQYIIDITGPGSISQLWGIMYSVQRMLSNKVECECITEELILWRGPPPYRANRITRFHTWEGDWDSNPQKNSGKIRKPKKLYKNSNRNAEKRRRIRRAWRRQLCREARKRDTADQSHNNTGGNLNNDANNNPNNGAGGDSNVAANNNHDNNTDDNRNEDDNDDNNNDPLAGRGAELAAGQGHESAVK